jgi:peroxiredoxin
VGFAAGRGLGYVSGGGCWSERLLGAKLPSVPFRSTGGGELDLAGLSAGPLLVFVHPGVEVGVGSERDPDGLLGSGCTVQARGFREMALDFAARQIKVVGLSSVSTEQQQTFALREGLPFALLSDPALELVGALGLPTYLTADRRRLYERLSFLAYQGSIQRIFHPIPIPRRNAPDILTHINYHHTHH